MKRPCLQAFSTVIIFIFLSSFTLGTPWCYFLDTEQSYVQWSATESNGQPISWRTSFNTGMYCPYSHYHGSLSINMVLMETSDSAQTKDVNYGLVQRLFETDTFPNANIEIVESKKIGDFDFEVSGFLTLKDSTNPINFVLSQSNSISKGKYKSIDTYSASIPVNLLDFGIPHTTFPEDFRLDFHLVGLWENF